MSLPVTVIALDLREIFLFFLDGDGVNTCCRRVMATTLSLSAPVAPRTSLLVVSVLLGGGSLLSRRELFSTDVSAEGESIDLFFPPESFSSFLTGLFPWGHLESMSQILKEDYSNAFASALTAFLTASSQESLFRPRVSNWARTEGLRLSRKYWILVSSFGMAAESNSRKTACRYSRWAAQSRTSSS